MEVKCTQD